MLCSRPIAVAQALKTPSLLPFPASPVITPELPRSPFTTPFIEELPVYKAKEPVSRFNPPMQIDAAGEECGRPSHQRWSDFNPQKFYELRVRQANHSFHREQ
jgi:hypothetical protein